MATSVRKEEKNNRTILFKIKQTLSINQLQETNKNRHTRSFAEIFNLTSIKNKDIIHLYSFYLSAIDLEKNYKFD